MYARIKRWWPALLILLAVVVVALGALDGQWWREVYYGRPLELDVFAIAQLPLPLIEAYGSNRWHEGMDAIWEPESGCLYVLVRWGQKPTGGYYVEPQGASLRRRPGGWTVVVSSRYVTPQPGHPVIEVVTFPAAGARIKLPQPPGSFKVVPVDQNGRVRGDVLTLP